MKTRKIGRTCNVCHQFIDGKEQDLILHGEISHPDYFYNGHANAYFKKKNYFNPLTNRWFEARKWMARDIKNISNEEYYLKYGKTYMPKEWYDNNNDPIYGDSPNKNTCLECNKIVKFDEGHWSYPVFCGSKCSVAWHNARGRSQRAHETIKEKREIDPAFAANPTQLIYWLNKGYSEEEAQQAVKERQTTNSLEKFIERANGDVEKGTQAWMSRQEKWIESIKKSTMFGGYSEKSKELFSTLSERLPYLYLEHGKNERSLRIGNQVIKPDCYCFSKQKIIEFFGDYWHANPLLYEDNQMVGTHSNKTTAKERRNIDKNRIEAIKEKGIDILVIWEKEYTDNPEETIQRCITFLTE